MNKDTLNSKRLILEREKITKLNNLKGGSAGDMSAGCTDGCSPFGSFWNCTNANCSADCSTSFCPATNTGYPGTMQ